jgi:hypothetical protein
MAEETALDPGNSPRRYFRWEAILQLYEHLLAPTLSTCSLPLMHWMKPRSISDRVHINPDEFHAQTLLYTCAPIS